MTVLTRGIPPELPAIDLPETCTATRCKASLNDHAGHPILHVSGRCIRTYLRAGLHIITATIVNSALLGCAWRAPKGL